MISERNSNPMWYVLDCEPDAYLYYGLNKMLSKEEFRLHIENDTILDVLNKVSVHKGDSIFIPAQNGCYEILGTCEIVLSHI